MRILKDLGTLRFDVHKVAAVFVSRKACSAQRQVKPTWSSEWAQRGARVKVMSRVCQHWPAPFAMLQHPAAPGVWLERLLSNLAPTSLKATPPVAQWDAPGAKHRLLPSLPVVSTSLAGSLTHLVAAYDVCTYP